jgi:hypothetical protein
MHPIPFTLRSTTLETCPIVTHAMRAGTTAGVGNGGMGKRKITPMMEKDNT